MSDSFNDIRLQDIESFIMNWLSELNKKWDDSLLNQLDSLELLILINDLEGFFKDSASSNLIKSNIFIEINEETNFKKFARKVYDFKKRTS